MKYSEEFKEYGNHIDISDYDDEGNEYRIDRYECRCCSEEKPLNIFGVCESCYTSSMEHLVKQVKENIGDFFSDTEIDGGNYNDIVEELFSFL